MPNGETFHIQGIYDAQAKECERYRDFQEIPVPSFHSMADVQRVIDELKAHGNFVMINHPYWSFNTFAHLHALHGYDFMEIYNHGCQVEGDLGNSEIFYDEVLKERTINAIASDDNHNRHRYQPGVHLWDSFGGYVMLQTAELTREGVSKALHEGRFYASSGVELMQVSYKDGVVSVRCSPCAQIFFKSWPRRGYSLQDASGQLCFGSYRLRGGERWIRVKCVDLQGRCAWSNPIMIAQDG